jgi:glycerol-3-phosphate cytidylyltransferase-like family protein
LERVEAVKKTGLADQIIIEDYVGQKIDDIQKYDVDIFAIGSDWEGKFDYLNETSMKEDTSIAASDILPSYNPIH